MLGLNETLEQEFPGMWLVTGRIWDNQIRINNFSERPVRPGLYIVLSEELLTVDNPVSTNRDRKVWDRGLDTVINYRLKIKNPIVPVIYHVNDKYTLMKFDLKDIEYVMYFSLLEKLIESFVMEEVDIDYFLIRKMFSARQNIYSDYSEDCFEEYKNQLKGIV